MNANFETHIRNLATSQLEVMAEQAKKTLVNKEQTVVIWRELHKRYAARFDVMTEPQF